MTAIQRIKDQPGGVWAEDASNLIRTKYGARGRNLLVQPYVEEVMQRITKDLEDQGFPVGQDDLFRILSSYRTQAEQDVIFQRELKERGGDEATTRDYVAKVSAHQTGAVVDIQLGGGTESENIPAIERTPQFEAWRDLAYNKYKMAPYTVEPWHWECGNACKENIRKMIEEETQQSFDPGWDSQSKGVGKQKGDEPPIRSSKPKSPSNSSVGGLIIGGVVLCGVVGGLFWLNKQGKLGKLTKKRIRK